MYFEINILGPPKTALFGFCVALTSYNPMATIKASLRSLRKLGKN